MNLVSNNVILQWYCTASICDRQPMMTAGVTFYFWLLCYYQRINWFLSPLFCCCNLATYILIWGDVGSTLLHTDEQNFGKLSKSPDDITHVHDMPHTPPCHTNVLCQSLLFTWLEPPFKISNQTQPVWFKCLCVSHKDEYVGECFHLVKKQNVTAHTIYLNCEGRYPDLGRKHFRGGEIM